MSSRSNPKTPLRRTASRADVVTAARTVSRALSRPARPRMVPRPRSAPGYFDTAVTSFNLSTTGSIVHINPVPQGVTTVTRVGKRIRMKSLQILGSAQAGSTGSILDCACMLVYDRRPNTVVAGISDILVSSTPNNFLNDTNSNRFRILKRWDFTLNGNTTTPTSNTTLDMTTYFKFPAKYANVSYKALGTGAMDDIDEGAIYFLAVGGNAAGTSAGVCQLAFRLRFYDESG